MLSKNFALAAILVGAPALLSSGAWAQGVAADGQDEFTGKCGICHNVDPGGPGGAGPNLYGVYGTKAGSRPGFEYSDAMKASGITWTDDTLNKYLQAPGTVVPGTKMAAGFSGTTPDFAADITAYLKTLSGAAPAAAAPAAPPADAAAPATPAPAPQ